MNFIFRISEELGDMSGTASFLSSSSLSKSYASIASLLASCMRGSMPAMACGTGEMDYGKLMKFARERNLSMTLENTKPDNAVGARQFLQSIEERCKAEP